ncbi:hypothetical protein L7F22_059781 [Adiantum nelumboides]|nr:hypothetical protein [Adiantum nelumboides]
MKEGTTLNELTKEALYLVNNCAIYKEGKFKDFDDDTQKGDLEVTHDQIVENGLKKINLTSKPQYAPPTQVAPQQVPPLLRYVRRNVPRPMEMERPQPVLGQQPPFPGARPIGVRMPRQKTARQWDKAPYEVDELLTNEKSHIPDEVLAQIPAHIFIAKFRDEEGDNIKTTIMPREIRTLHRRPKVASAVRAVHLEQFIRLPPWGTDYMRAHELMSSIQTTISAASSRSTRSKKSSFDEERTDTDKEQDSQESAQEDVPKEVEAAGPSEYERSDEEDTSTPLEKRSQKPRSREQVLMDEAMARVEARRKELVDARAAKAAKIARPMTMEEARKLRIEKAKAIQKERRRIEAEKKAQEEAEAAQATQTQEKEVIDLSGTIEYLKKIEREKHIAEQRAAQLAREKIKEALSRKAEEPVLEPTQGSPKRPRQEDEEELEHIQADPIPPSPINIPPASPSSPITPFPPTSTPRTPSSPSPLDLPKSPPTPTSLQQQQFSAEPIEIPTSIQEEIKQPMDKTEEEEKQTGSEQHKPADVNLLIPIIQLDEPTNEEAVQEVKNFDYTRLIQTLSRQFKCQQVVAKETDIQKDRANKAYEEITNLRTALELVTQKRDTNARENENLLRDLIDLQSQLTRKEAQNHELIKNEKKMKEQLKYEDARFQKLTASYNTIKTTLTALLQNQELASAPSTSDSATANTLAALQEELQTEKLQRQLLVSGFMSQTAQHEAKVKQLELELAQAKAKLEAVGSRASTSQIHQAETHLQFQQPLMPEMPKFQSPKEEEQPRPAPGISTT